MLDTPYLHPLISVRGISEAVALSSPEGLAATTSPQAAPSNYPPQEAHTKHVCGEEGQTPPNETCLR